LPARRRHDLLGGPARTRQEPEGGVGPRHRGRLPGPRPLRQPRRGAEHVPRPRGHPWGLPGRGRDGAHRRRDAEGPPGHHGAVRPPARGRALRRPATVRRGREGRDVELEAGDPRRAHGGAGRGPDAPGAAAREAPGGAGTGGADDLAQPRRRLRGRRPHRRDALRRGRQRAARLGDGRPDHRRADDDGQAEGRVSDAAEGPDAPEFAASRARFLPGLTGVLPVILGVVAIAVIFQSLNQRFLTTGNLVNLLVQGSVFMLIGMGRVFVLLLGEIDLSLGYVAGIAAVVVTMLVQPATNWPWWAAVLAALSCTAAIGFFQGTLITRLRLPSFVVTLAGLLAWQGVMIMV